MRGLKIFYLIMIVLLVALTSCAQPKQNVVHVIKMPPPDMVEQLKLKQIDGFVAWEPFPSKAFVNGYGKLLLNSSQIWKNHPCCVVAVRDGLDNNVVKAIVFAHVKATRFVNNPENREKVLKYAAEFTGLDEKTVEMALKNIKFIEFPDEEQFRTYYHFLNSSGLLTKSIKQLGYKNEDEFFSDFLDRSVYNEVSESSSDTIPKLENKKVRIGYLRADLHQLAFYVALREGYYKEMGIDVDAKVYANGVEVMNAFKIGELDTAYLGSAPATLKRINEDVKIRVVAGVNNEGSAIVVRDGINSVKDLAGKKIAIPGFGTVQDFLLRMVVDKAGLKLEVV
ncbi:nitrate ABC transporter ATP-binding protein [Archaeoglobales archaeon]|nr:MAG: nitrate ABC transporter ATP-binding protein [Archaeoglobales archaeon]